MSFKSKKVRNFRDIQVWHKAHDLTLKVYKVTKSFPREETYGLTSQMRRASYSIPTNIAEGCGRDSNIELGRFFTIAMGSASELEYTLLLSRDLGYVKGKYYEDLNAAVTEIKRMLATYLKKIRTSSKKRRSLTSEV